MPNNTITALKISGNRYFGVMTPNLKFWLKLSSVCMEEVSMKMIPNTLPIHQKYIWLEKIHSGTLSVIDWPQSLQQVGIISTENRTKFCKFDYHWSLLVSVKSTLLMVSHHFQFFPCTVMGKVLAKSLFLSVTASTTSPSSQGSHSNRQDQFSANWASGNCSSF